MKEETQVKLYLLGSDFGGSNRKLSPTAISCARAMSVTPSDSLSTSSRFMNFGGEAENNNAIAEVTGDSRLAENNIGIV